MTRKPEYETAPSRIERALKWTGYKVRVLREAGYPCTWDKKYPYDHFRYRVSIYGNNRLTWFYFWGSNADYWEQGKNGPPKGEMIGMWLHDAEYAENDFEEFCADLGMNSDSIADKKTYDHCVRARKAALRVFGERLFGHLCRASYQM